MCVALRGGEEVIILWATKNLEPGQRLILLVLVTCTSEEDSPNCLQFLLLVLLQSVYLIMILCPCLSIFGVYPC